MTVVRLLRVPLPVDCSPEAALRALGGDAWPFALTGRWAGGGAIVGSEPLHVAEPGEDPFALLDALPDVAPADGAGKDAAGAADAVGGGWFGWLGYGLGARVERLPPPPPRPAALPPFQLAYYDHVLHLDAAGRWWFEALATSDRRPHLDARLARLRDLLSRPALVSHSDTNPGQPPEFRVAGGGAGAHVAAVAECRERIAAGEIFQANVCLRLESAWEGDVAELFARASARLRPAYGAAFPAPWGGIASLSPELFLRRRGRAVETAPIKGTIARADGADAARDSDAARASLNASVKDHAEHVMIVDLMRNDLGRVGVYGSIEAAPTPEAQAHPGVWHLVSRVQGTLRPDVGDGDLLRATFPPGSVTGAPKVQAMHVIAALEGTGREVYTGAIGYASPLAGLELNVAIRTFEARDGRLWLGAGGGIVADSDPARELEECLVKARPLVAAIGGAIETTPLGVLRTASSTTAPALDRRRARPDPAAGVFETLLVRDGVALHAAEHVARLAHSAERLYGLPLPDDLAERVTAASEGAGGVRLRVVAVPSRGRLDVTLALAPNPRRQLPVVLAPFTLSGGLGAHKWLDRQLLDTLAQQAGGATPLLLDGDGSVLEAAWANVFAIEEERLLTPPADGRILPGVTRALLLDAAEEAGLTAVEQPLRLDDLAAADAVLLSSSAALVVPARLAREPGADERAAGERGADEPGTDERAARLTRRLLRAVEARSAPVSGARTD
ncbi:bifunctional chorismate-binding protein/class IV aminotransferase [Conexibacter woesei]|uniref:Chorismate binding-like protein n=1 Tax=Conexibacter woesei (strain DSM 14684 / CCUG 47730 / CIP 108061 / JCM 11494 / NBRC 100937 / ID131577) TaxID=469383 RepID=D3FDM8_CONWI|nr:bifunctional chorismate-binding protein/class IV aminotransferase [Conexibacter woesei]ADB49602.1 Chorismate binding-like protein [Conexibacter woesei DSM 14684]